MLNIATGYKPAGYELCKVLVLIQHSTMLLYNSIVDRTWYSLLLLLLLGCLLSSLVDCCLVDCCELFVLARSLRLAVGEETSSDALRSLFLSEQHSELAMSHKVAFLLLEYRVCSE